MEFDGKLTFYVVLSQFNLQFVPMTQVVVFPIFHKCLLCEDLNIVDKSFDFQSDIFPRKLKDHVDGSRSLYFVATFTNEV